MNTLYYGDNLQVLRDHVPDGSVDLVYLDPPFNSNASYNVLFRERTGEGSAAQIRAFEDTWEWGDEAARNLNDLLTGDRAGTPVKEMMGAFRQFLGASDMMAYLAMMAPRLVELRRVLRPAGSLYLHCDPTASHYLKLLLDAAFGPNNFRSEIAWKRTSAHSASKRWGPVHDIVLFYTKTHSFVWNTVFAGYSEDYVKSFYRYSDEKGRFRVGDLTGAGTRNGESGEPWRGVNPTEVGRHWAVPNKVLKELLGSEFDNLTVQAKLDALDQAGLIVWPTKGNVPQFKRYFNEKAGVAILDVITDINPPSAQSAERLGYPTQKPEALLERIIRASSNEGDVVLDPFCGCGTAVAAAQKLNRQWIGIDITHLAVALMKHRLKDMFNLDPAYRAPKGGALPPDQYLVVGEPVDLEGARTLAQEDRYQFQYWALSLLEARPEERKRGADRGVDGTIFFLDGPQRSSHKAIVQVKSGGVHSGDIRDLAGVLGREKAALGLFITLEEPTQAMRAEAAGAGFFHSDLMGKDYPQVQIRTVEELLGGRAFEMPLRPVQHQQAQRFRRREGVQSSLLDQGGAAQEAGGA